jgi:RNA polymerase sigma-70 factor (ECF subfamily)
MRPESCEGKPDAQIVRLASQNPAFFECLVDRYEAKLGRYVRRLGGFSPETVEDILQEVFLKAYKNLNGYDETYPFNGWIYRIAHNEAISHFRKTSARPESVSLESDEGEDLLSLLPSKIDLAGEYAHNETALKVRELLFRLPEKYRSVLVLHFLEDKGYDEISDILRIPSGTVATNIRRAKQQFKQLAVEHHLSPNP